MYRPSRKTEIAEAALRIILGAVFVFSGFVKGVDPWGTAIKLGEYFSAFHLGWLNGAKYVLSVILSAAETGLGLMLIFRLKMKSVSFLVLLFMIFFTLLTLGIALTNPVADCGCFGDAVKLTNWQTFYKNLVLLPLALLLWLAVRRMPARPGGNGFVFLLLLLAAAPGVWGLYHLPLIDFLPYREGVNIRQSMELPEGADAGEYRTTLIYKDKSTGEVREFEVADTTWQDETRWEFVDSRSEEIRPAYVPAISDFNVFDAAGDATSRILGSEGDVYLFVIDRIEEADAEDVGKIRGAAAIAARTGGTVAVLTVSPLAECRTLEREAGSGIVCYNMDGTTLKTLLRAHKGLVLLNGGTIVAKRNMRDVPLLEVSDAASGVAWAVGENRRRTEQNAVIVFAALAVVLLSYRFLCGRR